MCVFNQFNGETLLQWTDRHGTTHPIETLGKSLCNLKALTTSTDEGKIFNKTLLPIMGFSYGPLVESAKFTIGSLKCDPKQRNHKEQILNQIDRIESRTSNIESKISCSACLTMNVTLSNDPLEKHKKIPGLYKQSNLEH